MLLLYDAVHPLCLCLSLRMTRRDCIQTWLFGISAFSAVLFKARRHQGCDTAADACRAVVGAFQIQVKDRQRPTETGRG